MGELNDKLPFKLHISIASIVLAENVVMNMINPILPFMIEYFFEDRYPNGVPEDIISNYSGYLEGVYRFMQFFACLTW